MPITWYTSLGSPTPSFPEPRDSTCRPLAEQPARLFPQRIPLVTERGSSGGGGGSGSGVSGGGGSGGGGGGGSSGGIGGGGGVGGGGGQTTRAGRCWNRLLCTSFAAVTLSSLGLALYLHLRLALASSASGAREARSPFPLIAHEIWLGDQMPAVKRMLYERNQELLTPWGWKLRLWGRGLHSFQRST
jgi:hypothetical protein